MKIGPVRAKALSLLLACVQRQTPTRTACSTPLTSALVDLALARYTATTPVELLDFEVE